MKSLLRLIRMVVPGHRAALFFAVVSALLISATPYAFSFLGKWLVDDVLSVGARIGTGHSEAEKIVLLFRFFLISIAFHTAGTAFAVLSEYLNQRSVHKMTYELRSSVFEKVSSADLVSDTREPPGQLMTRVMDDTGAIPGNVTHIIINTITQIAMLALGVVLLIRLNAALTIYVAVALPFYAVLCILFLPAIRKNTGEIRVRWASLMAFAVERLINIITVKNYAREQAETAEFDKRVQTSLNLNRRQHKLTLVFGSLSALVTAFATIAVLAIGFLKIKSGAMQLGEVMAFYQVTAQLFVPISALVGMTVISQTVRVYAERVFQILDATSKLTDGENAPSRRGDIEFENVSLRFAENGPFALSDLSLVIERGKTTALVGPTGCGKSTVILLLTRMLDPDQGVIRVGGVDLRTMAIVEHRRSVGNVFFDSALFGGTLAENIAFGSESISHAEIAEACRVVDLTAFVSSLPKGLETELGAGGVQVEGEELVKLNLARAIVTKPKILTVDDTFSQVREETERRLRDAIRTALPDITMVIATSRLSIAETCDRIYVLRKGTAVENGTHATLMSQPGLYRRLYSSQMGLPF